VSPATGRADQPVGQANGHPRHDLEPLLLHGVRFSVLAIAVAADKVAFAYVRDALGVTDPVLSKQLTALEAAGMVVVGKVAEGRRARTWVRATDEGLAAFSRHRAALQAIADGGGPAGQPRSTPDR
jgi:DNA-binding MarR family transcriptional regulator